MVSTFHKSFSRLPGAEGGGVSFGVGWGTGVVTEMRAFWQQPIRIWNANYHRAYVETIPQTSSRQTKYKITSLSSQLLTGSGGITVVPSDNHVHIRYTSWPFVYHVQVVHAKNCQPTSTSSIAMSPIGWPICLVVARILMTWVGNRSTLNWTNRHWSPCSVNQRYLRILHWISETSSGRANYLHCDVRF